MKNQSRLLLVRSNINQDESLEGYAIRLGIENEYDYGHYGFFRSFINNQTKHQFYSPPLHKLLARVTGKTEDYYYQRESYQLGYDLLLPNRFRSHLVRFCPMCLHEEKYHRIDWFVKPYK